jgi:uncharacterized protein YegL
MAINFDRVELDTSNPEPRCPCVLLLDTSYSMDGSPIDELNTGLQVFKENLCADDLTMLRVEVAVVTFGGSVDIVQDFVTADQFQPPHLDVNGDTPMGSAINVALDHLDARKQGYQRSGLGYFRPWVFLITDGAPTDGDLWRTAAQRVQKEEAAKKVAFFAVGVADADMKMLAQISQRQPVSLQGLNFREMFVWLSNSLTKVSHSEPDAEIPLQSPLGWGKI